VHRSGSLCIAREEHALAISCQPPRSPISYLPNFAFRMADEGHVIDGGKSDERSSANRHAQRLDLAGKYNCNCDSF
jgi:hypothetical protein